jgi:hypothetical protein
MVEMQNDIEALAHVTADRGNEAILAEMRTILQDQLANVAYELRPQLRLAVANQANRKSLAW